MDIMVNTGAVLAASESIDTINKKIQSDLSDVEAALRRMRQSWEGDAANACTNSYDQIKERLGEARFAVVNGLVSFMKYQVGEGYDTTEQAVSSAASAFK